MHAEVDVVVVGGGPGGLSAANAVRIARPDLSVRVYERSKSLRAIGHSLVICENGIKALKAIDAQMAERVFEHFTPLVRYYTSDYITETVFKPGEILAGRSMGLTPWFRLRNALAEATPEECLKLGHSLEAISPSESGVTLQFQNGETATAKVLLGSDGQMSRVRELLFNDGPPEFCNAANWLGTLEVPKDWEYEQTDILDWRRQGCDGTFMIQSMGGTMLGWKRSAPWKPEDHNLLKSGRYIDDGDRATTAAKCKQRALDSLDKDLPDFARKLVEATDPENIIENGHYCRNAEDCQKWGEGPVSLLGDAAHLFTPALGQGVNQALIDGLEFGRAVGQLGPTPEALRLYESVRMPVALKVHEASVSMFRKAFGDSKWNRSEESKWHEENPWCMLQELEPLVG